MTVFVRRYPLISFFVLTFVISWSGVIAVSFFMGMPTTSSQFERFGPIALSPFLLGPTIVGLLLTRIVHGRAGFSVLKSRLAKWRIGIGWYVFAVLTVPAILSVMLLILSQFSSDFIPKICIEKNKVEFALIAIITGLVGGGVLEETGWTGFATPIMIERFGPYRAGLVLGVIWGFWHFLPVFWASGDASGMIDWALFLPGLFCHYVVLIPYRILIIRLYDHTLAFLPVMLMHASLTAFSSFILNIYAAGWPLFFYFLILAAALWFIVAVVYKLDYREMTAIDRKNGSYGE